MPSQEPIITNSAKEKLKAGRSITGMNVFESLRPSVVKVAAMVGFDLILADTEHVVHNDETLTNFLVLARDNGLAPIVTVVAPERALVSRMLDAGALGIILSHAETAEQVEDLVRWTKYAPEGERGVAMGANAGYDNIEVARYCREANEATLVLPKIESAVGVRNAESIMDVEGVDGIVFGPGDLSVKMGFHGQWEHPEVLAAMEGVVQGALARGLAVEPPIMPTDRAAYERELERGIRIFGAMRRSEYDLLKEAANNVMAVYL